MQRFIIAVVVLTLSAWLWLQQQPKDTTQNLPDLPGFDLQAVQRVSITQDGHITLDAKRDGLIWKDATSATLLNALALDQLLHDLQQMSPKRVVSRNAETYAHFEVAEQHPHIVLKGVDHQLLLDVIVGKPATDLVSTYIRFADQTTVLTVNKILTWQVKRTSESWLHKEEKTE